jgi:hypothetical protein
MNYQNQQSYTDMTNGLIMTPENKRNSLVTDHYQFHLEQMPFSMNSAPRGFNNQIVYPIMGDNVQALTSQSAKKSSFAQPRASQSTSYHVGGSSNANGINHKHSYT